MIGFKSTNCKDKGCNGIKPEEFGLLEGYENNRYWEMRLSKFNFLIGGSGWLYTLCWRILTLVTFIPLLLVARYYSQKLWLDAEEKDITIPYSNFTDIYPGCVYSPLVKGYELELFKKCHMEGPILEIAIGDGYFSSLLFKSKKQRLDYGADLIYGTIKSATKYNHCEEYLVMDAMQIPFPDNCLGTVVMNNLMHHLPDRALAVKEVLRVLKKGGKFIFTDNTIGWGVFTWNQLLLRRLRLYSFADYILKLNMRLFAQKLLVDEHYYDKRSREENFKIIRKVNFISKTSMYLGSIFEFLNLKMGQPTRKEMIRWVNLFGFRNKLDGYIEKIIKYCIVKDRELCQTEGCAFWFLEIEKLGESEINKEYRDRTIPYVCPKCKQGLVAYAGVFYCKCCDIKYPVVEGIPLFVSYQAKVKGFHSYIEKKKRGKSEEFIT